MAILPKTLQAAIPWQKLLPGSAEKEPIPFPIFIDKSHSAPLKRMESSQRIRYCNDVRCFDLSCCNDANSCSDLSRDNDIVCRNDHGGVAISAGGAAVGVRGGVPYASLPPLLTGPRAGIFRFWGKSEAGLAGKGFNCNGEL